MADNEIVVTLTADTSQFTQAMAQAGQSIKIVDSGSAAAAPKRSVDEMSAAMSTWRKESGLSEKATITLGRGFTELRGVVGKTAADFAPATQAMREASLGMKEFEAGANRSAGSLGRVLTVYGAYYAASRVINEVKQLWTDYSTEESAGRHMDLVEGTGKTGRPGTMTDRDTGRVISRTRGGESQSIQDRIAKAAMAENYQASDYDKIGMSLSAAGIHGDKLVGTLTKLGETSRVSGVPMEQLATLSQTVQFNLEATWAQMESVAATGNDGAQKLADSWRDLSVSIIAYNINLERTNTLQDREFQLSQRKRTGEQGDIGSTGVGEAYLKASTGQKLSKKEAALLGVAGMMGGKIPGEIAAGEADMAKEMGLPIETIKYMESIGAIGYGQLSGAESRRISNEREDTLYGRKVTAQEKEIGDTETRRGMARQAAQIVQETPPEAVAAQKASGEGRGQALANALRTASIAAGGLIVNPNQRDPALEQTAKMEAGWFDWLPHFGQPAGRPVSGSQMPVHAARIKKPGEPGYDWSQYHPTSALGTGQDQGQSASTSAVGKLDQIAKNTEIMAKAFA